MEMKKIFSWIFGVIVSTFLMCGCATGQSLVNHSFEFDAVRESPDIEVLNYQYGNLKQPGARMPEWAIEQGRVWGGTGTYGLMPPGEFLYVKWRIKSTGEVVEDKVDLKTRFPADITDHRVHFVIDGRQLYVLLISDKERVDGLCPRGIKPGEEHREFRRSLSPLERAKYKYCYLKIITLYPDQPKP